MKTNITLPGFSEMSLSTTKFYKTITKFTGVKVSSKIIPNDKCCGLSCSGGCTCMHGHAHCHENAMVIEG